MGIPGLLIALKSITRTQHVNAYCGMRVAVDAHCWLHRGGYSCSRELAEGLSTMKYVEFCMNMLTMLQDHGGKVLLLLSLHLFTSTNPTLRCSQKSHRRCLQQKSSISR